MSENTTAAELEIDVQGPISEVIERLGKLKAEHPDGYVDISTDAYGSIETTLRYERPLEPAEIALREIEAKRRELAQLEKAADVFSSEGAVFPRRGEIEALRKELGIFADLNQQVSIVNGKVTPWTVEWDFHERFGVTA